MHLAPQDTMGRQQPPENMQVGYCDTVDVHQFFLCCSLFRKNGTTICLIHTTCQETRARMAKRMAPAALAAATLMRNHQTAQNLWRQKLKSLAPQL